MKNDSLFNKPKEYIWLEYERASRLHDFYFYALLVTIIGVMLVARKTRSGALVLSVIGTIIAVLYGCALVARNQNCAVLRKKILEESPASRSRR